MCIPHLDSSLSSPLPSTQNRLLLDFVNLPEHLEAAHMELGLENKTSGSIYCKPHRDFMSLAEAPSFPLLAHGKLGGGCFARGQGRSHSAGKSAWERQECESGKNKARKKRNGAKIGVGRTLGQDVDRMILAAMSISHILSSLPALLLLAQIQVDPAGQ